MKLLLKLFLIIPIAFLTSCSTDDDTIQIGDPFVGETKTYQLVSVDDPSISGEAKFIENLDGSTTVELQLTGTPIGEIHPAHIHFNTAAESGAIAITLESVNGDTGFSSTTVTALNDDQGGTAISYDELLDFDGYINVHSSATDLGTLVAQGDIGQNGLTGNEIVYDLAMADVPNISGIATFSERENGEALAVIALEGTFDTDVHPGHIHMNTAAEGGDIAFTFNPVIGATGISQTNVSALNDNSSFGYTDILDFDGYINIHLSADNLEFLVAQGDIGQNDLNGNSVTYSLATVDVPGISGTATFFERNNGEALALLSLNGTANDGLYPAHIHMGSITTAPGDILYTFTPVDGLTGMSVSNVAALDDDTVFGYEDVLTVDGYINVHLSADELETLVAQGNIGIN